MMIYVMECKCDSASTPWRASWTLWEMTDKEFDAAVEGDTKMHWHRRTSVADAHAHVKRGNVHNTSLWVDDKGKIRRARGEA